MLASFAFALFAAAASAVPGPCALVPAEAIASVQGAKFVAGKESRSKGAAIDRRDCFYETDPLADSVSLEWIADAVPGGARRRWNVLFHGSDADGREEEREAPKAPPKPVAGIGEEAFWIGQPHGGALYVLAGDPGFLRVSVGGSAAGDEKRERSRRIAARAVEALRAAAAESAGRKKSDPPVRPDQAREPDLR